MIITEVEKYQRGWTGGRPETECGAGSKIEQTEIQREWIPRMVEKYNIRSITDMGAGDLRWIKLIKWPHEVHYKAFDLVPRHDEVTQFDIIQDKPQPVDLLMCIWCLNHFPDDHARVALDNLQASGSTYLMLTYWPKMADFLDIEPIETVMIRPRINAELRLIRNEVRL